MSPGPCSPRLRSRSLLVATVALASLGVVGCGGGDSGTSKKDGEGSSGGGERQRVVDRKNCSDLLESTLGSLRPDDYHTGDTSAALTLLDNWRVDCITAQTEATRDAMIGERTRARLDDELLARVEGEQFTEQDATHVRSSLLFRTAATAAFEDGETELAKVMNLFRFVVRNVQLLEEDAPLAGPGAFETFLYGEGSARDRAWILAELLRQQRVDAVILSPVSEGEDDPTAGRWLVGVLLDGECYLFDPRLGLPVPPPDDGTTAVPARPATLAEVRSDGSLLAKLGTADHPHPLADANLDALRVQVVGNSSTLAPRLVGMQGILTGRRNVLILESLDDPEARLGRRNLLDRVAEGSDAWTADDVGVWSYPEQCLTRTLDDRTPESRTAILARDEVFTGVHRDGRRLLLLGRLQHLRGRITTAPDEGTSAVTAYTAARDIGSDASSLHEESARDARFWLGMCFLESGDHRTAETALQSYVSPAWNGRFERTAQLVRAIGKAERGGPDLAIAELDAIADPGPDAALVAYLKNRWSTEEPKTTEPPTTDPPTTDPPITDPPKPDPAPTDEPKNDDPTADPDGDSKSDDPEPGDTPKDDTGSDDALQETPEKGESPEQSADDPAEGDASP